jgi:hypothetical protein
MAERDLTSTGAHVVLALSVCALLSAGVGNVLLAVTESVVWPLILGVVWVLFAVVVVVEAEAAAPSRSRTLPAGRFPVVAAGPVRPW